MFLTVALNALSPSMAKSLSKRQRKEVTRIVRQTISPEWKVTEFKAGPAPIDIANNLTGWDLTSYVAQGLGASNRIGDQIRVKRIELYYSWNTPVDARVQSPIRCGNLIYRRQNDAALYLTQMSDAWELSLVPLPYFLYGPTPMKRDLETRGVFIRKMRRHRVKALSPGATRVWRRDLQLSNLAQIEGLGASATGTYTGTSGAPPAADVGTWTADPGDFTFIGPDQQRDYDCGFMYERFRLTLKFPGDGLLVTFANTALEIVNSNHLYYMVAASLPSGLAAASPLQCPNHEFAMRLWFTDD